MSYLLSCQIKKPSAKSRGQEIPVVPPQFTAKAASWDSNKSAGCIGPYPSSPTTFVTTDLIIGYFGFKKATPKGIPHPGLHCLAPSGSSLAESLEMYWFSSTRYRYVMHSLPLSVSQVKREQVKSFTNYSLRFCRFCQCERNSCLSQKNSQRILQFFTGVL